MSEELNFEDELANLLSEMGDDFVDISENSTPPASVEQPVKTPAPQPDRAKERILSQAEIDLLLANLNIQD